MDKTQRFLVAYSAVVTAAFVTVVIVGLRERHRPLDRLQVQRLDVVEPDGTLRMVLSNHAHLPGVIVRGKEQPPADRPQAGLLFFNDEASEVGGLIFGGRKDAAGKVRDAGGSLTFDRYEANQIVQLMGVDDAEDKIAGLLVSDSPSGTDVRRRIWLGRREDGIATLALLDGQGRKRLLLQVTPEGKASISALDAEGHRVKELLP